MTMPEAPGTEHLPPVPCAQSPAAPSGSLEGRQKRPAEGSCRAQGGGQSQERLDSVGGLNYPEAVLRIQSIEESKEQEGGM